MLIGVVFTALAALLSRLSPRNWGRRHRGRRSRRRIRIWRKRRSTYRSRLQQRQSQSTADVSHRVESVAATVPDNRNASTPVRVSTASSSVHLSVQQQQSTTGTPARSTALDGPIGVETATDTARSAPTYYDQATSSLLNVFIEEDEVLCTPSTGFSVVDIALPSCGLVNRQASMSMDDQVSDNDSASCETFIPRCNSTTTIPDYGDPSMDSSICEVKSEDDSEKHIEVTSTHTSDSGYTDASTNSIDTGITGITSESMDTLTEAKEEYTRDKVYKRVEKEGIVLEEIQFGSDRKTVVGTLLVRNDCYEKNVGARHTVDGWVTYKDTAAEWIETTEGGRFDRFKVCVELPEGESYRVMELAFFFGDHWDNNGGTNHFVSL